jgi:DNA-binding PadR family transcriptional regulator
MTLKMFNIAPDGTLVSSNEERLIGDVYASELELEKVVATLAPSLAEVLGVTALETIGKQVSVRAAARQGRGLTLDLLLIDQDLLLYVVEMKINADMHSFGQAYTYGCQLRNSNMWRIAEIYAGYLRDHMSIEVDVTKALSMLSDFAGNTLDLAELGESVIEKPALVVITPYVTAEELAVAEGLVEDGVEAILLQPRVFSMGEQLSLVMQRVFPALEPQNEGKFGSRGRNSRRVDPSTNLSRKVLDYLRTASETNQKTTSTELRIAIGSSVMFPSVIQELESGGLVEKCRDHNGKVGRPSMVYAITESGLSWLKNMDAEQAELATKSLESSELEDGEFFDDAPNRSR